MPTHEITWAKLLVVSAAGIPNRASLKWAIAHNRLSPYYLIAMDTATTIHDIDKNETTPRQEVAS